MDIVVIVSVVQAFRNPENRNRASANRCCQQRSLKQTIMKSILSFSKLALVVATIVMLLQSCNKNTSFLTSTVVPAAEGSVRIVNDRNSNYEIGIEIIRLAQPERLSPAKSVYVVWMQTKNDGIKNIGQLKTSSGFMSRELKSSLQTVSSFEPTEIMITAEDNATESHPGTVVLTTGRL